MIEGEDFAPLSVEEGTRAYVALMINEPSMMRRFHVPREICRLIMSKSVSQPQTRGAIFTRGIGRTLLPIELNLGYLSEVLSWKKRAETTATRFILFPRTDLNLRIRMRKSPTLTSRTTWPCLEPVVTDEYRVEVEEH
jgi:hypothetical protein